MGVRILIKSREVEFPSALIVAIGIGQSETQLDQLEGINVEFNILIKLIF